MRPVPYKEKKSIFPFLCPSFKEIKSQDFVVEVGLSFVECDADTALSLIIVVNI
jgi:hypothetical protein